MVVLASPGQGQAPPAPVDRFFANIAFTPGTPVGEFADFVNFTYGVAGGVGVNLDPRGLAGVRADLSFLLYGEDELDTGERVQNAIVSFGIGPQVVLPGRVLRPHLFGVVGFSYFSTETFEVIGDEILSSTTNFDHVTFAVIGGGGVLIRVAENVMLDFSAAYYGNGQVEYLHSASLQQAGDGSYIIAPVESAGNLLMFRAGVSLGIGG
jgi:hypothetical protein